MSNIPEEILSSFNGKLEQIWKQVSEAVNASTGKEISFSNPSSAAVPAAEAYGAGGESVVAVQYSFSDLPENAQLLYLPDLTALAWAASFRGEPIEEVDENVVADLRQGLEGIVQGFCLAISTIRGEPVIASNLAIRHQQFNLPTNMARGAELSKVEVTIAGDAFSGQAFWLLDGLTTQYIVAAGSGSSDEISSDGEPHAFNPDPLPASDRMSHHSHEDSGGLDLLLDIPLEISVELGRVKMLVKEVVDLGTGSIVEIQKAAGEPVDVLVNGRLVARGEVVVIEDNFGVRITEILTSQERLAKLGEAA